MIVLYRKISITTNKVVMMIRSCPAVDLEEACATYLTRSCWRVGYAR